jgi:hypothetical protein
MSRRKPLVIVSGRMRQIPDGDEIDAPVSQSQVQSLTNGESSVALTKGMPVYISSAATVKRAQANAIGAADVFGLCDDDSIAAASSGMICTDGPLTVSDWTAIVGAATLTAGTTYFLDPDNPGMLTATAPETTGEVVVEVGKAVDTTTLNVKIRAAIQL